MPFILLAAALWGLLGPVAYLALREGVAPLELAFWRAAIGAALFGAHALVRGPRRVAARDVPAVLGFGLAGISLFYGAYFVAVQRGGAALAAVLLYTAPAWVALLSALRGERPGARGLAAVAITLVGVALVATAGGGPVRVSAGAVAAGLAAGLAYALYPLFGRHYFARYPAPTIFALALPVGALGLLPFVTLQPRSATAWAVFVFVAAVPTYGAYLLYAAGLRRVPPTRAATVATIEPVVAAVAAFAAFGERLAPLAYVGGALVVGGVLVTRPQGGDGRG